MFNEWTPLSFGWVTSRGKTCVDLRANLISTKVSAVNTSTRKAWQNGVANRHKSTRVHLASEKSATLGKSLRYCDKSYANTLHIVRKMTTQKFLPVEVIAVTH